MFKGKHLTVHSADALVDNGVADYIMNIFCAEKISL
jgi:hypothetical protein